MRYSIALIVLALAGCQNAKPTPPPIPTVVEVTVTKYVPVPVELTADCQDDTPKAQVYAEAKRLAIIRHEYLTECTQRMRKIRSLK